MVSEGIVVTGTFLLSGGVLLFEVNVRIIHSRRWFVAVAFSAIAMAALCWFYFKSQTQPDQKAVATAENEVYEAVVRDMVMPKNGQPPISQLVFSDTVDIYPCPGVDRASCEEGFRKRLLTAAGRPLRPETIQDFLQKSRTKGPLSTTFHTDLPRAFIDPNTVYFDLVPIEKNGQKDFGRIFPGANGIISLSHVGFDHTLHEAIVSSSFMCGGLCGTGRRHILRKKWGKWVVVESWIVWVA